MCHTTVYIERYRRVQDGGNETKEPRRFMFTCFKLKSTRTFLYIHRSSLVCMRSNLVDRMPMPKSQKSWVRSQHPPTQWNLMGSRWSSVEYSTWKKKKSKKIPLFSYSPTHQYPHYPPASISWHTQTESYTDNWGSFSLPPLLWHSLWTEAKKKK
jgi:hypothetical protein